MRSIPRAARRGPAHRARWRAAAALVPLAVLTVATTAQAAAAYPAGIPAAPAGSASLPLPKPQPIAVNTANWTGKAGFGSRAPAWYAGSSGVVHLQGAAAQTSAGGTDAPLIGTLPRAAWPTSTVALLAHSFGGTYASVEINETGQVFVLASAAPAVTDFSFVSLEGLSYRPDRAGTPINLNSNNWVPAAPGGYTPRWFTDRSGIVHLEGLADQTGISGPDPDTIGVLPPALAPARDVYTVVSAGQDAYADLVIQSSGDIILITPRPPAASESSLVSLDSISYRPVGSGTPIGVNKANWSGSAGYASGPPAWYTDSYGLVHLQGAVTQTSGSGTGANTIGTLPPAARPPAYVYTIVHTFNGTYADLVIEPSGAIDLLGTRPPMVQDYTFVSLESITYRR